MQLIFGTRRLVAVVCALSLVAAACGGDSDSTSTRPGVTGDSVAVSPAVSGVDAPVDDPVPDKGSDDTVAEVDRSSELIGRWDIVEYELRSGGLTNVLGEDAHLTFSADGSVDYGTGCNQGTVSYATSGVYVIPDSPFDDTPEGQSITLGPDFVQTEIACDGFVGEQDGDIPARLAEAIRFRLLDDGRLLLVDEFALVVAVRPS